MTIIETYINQKKEEVQKFGFIILRHPKLVAIKITKIDDKIHYTRGKSNISLSINVILETYAHFKGQICSTNALKDFDKIVYGNKPCNCIIFILLMSKAFNTPISGKGVKGDPFKIQL